MQWIRGVSKPRVALSLVGSVQRQKCELRSRHSHESPHAERWSSSSHIKMKNRLMASAPWRDYAFMRHKKHGITALNK
eukprot:3571088-Amphidinium_carterae.1